MEVLADVFIEVFKVLSYGHHELVRVCSVNNAVIIAQGQPDDVPHGDGVIAIFIGDHNWLLEDAAHAQDRNLRLQDDGCAELRSKNSRIGDGDGAALYVIRHQLFAACALAQIGDGALQADEAQVFRALHHRHNQSPLQGNGNSNVDGLVILDGVAHHGGVHDRLDADSVHEGLGDKGHERQLDAVAGFPRLAVFVTEPGNARHVYFEDRVDVRAGVLGFHHALGNLLAHRRHGNQFARHYLHGWRSCGPRCWRGLCGRLLLLWRRLRWTSLGRGHGLWPAGTLSSAMLLNEALNILLADAAAQPGPGDLGEIDVTFTRHAPYQR